MYLTAIDIGSSKIRVIAAQTDKNNKLAILDVFRAPSHGIRKGEIVDVQELTNVLSPIFNELRKISKETIRNIFVNINGKNINLHFSRGIVAVSRADNEIYQDDVDRVVKASQAVNLSPNRKIVHTIIREFIIDGAEQAQAPLGMNGSRLEVSSFIVEAFAPVYNDLVKAISLSGGTVSEIVYNPLAVSFSCLTKTHKELGAVLIDIGFGATGMTIFGDGRLLGAKVFPIGSSNITNDLAIALKSSIETAERIKLSFGSAFSREVSAKDKINLSEIDKNLKSVVSRKFIAEIIESRLAEIFELVNNELRDLGKPELPAGIILAGGGAKIEGLTDLARQEFKLPAHLANCETDIFSSSSQNLLSKIEDLEFSAATGLLAYGFNQVEKGSSVSDWFSDKSGALAKVLKNMMP